MIALIRFQIRAGSVIDEFPQFRGISGQMMAIIATGWHNFIRQLLLFGNFVSNPVQKLLRFRHTPHPDSSAGLPAFARLDDLKPVLAELSEVSTGRRLIEHDLVHGRSEQNWLALQVYRRCNQAHDVVGPARREFGEHIHATGSDEHQIRLPGQGDVLGILGLDMLPLAGERMATRKGLECERRDKSGRCVGHDHRHFRPGLGQMAHDRRHFITGNTATQTDDDSSALKFNRGY